jgi:hypothetical protein
MPVTKTASNKVLYAFRGFIAFVAFIDLGTALRNYVERRSFMSVNEELTDVKMIEADFTICRIMGIYSILKAITLIQTTLYIHDKGESAWSVMEFLSVRIFILACVMTGSMMLVVNMIFSITECLYFR